MNSPDHARAEAEAKRLAAQETEGPSYSSQLLWKKAAERGWKHKVLSHAYKFSVIEYADEDGDIQRCMIRNARTSLVTATGALIADDKMLTYAMAQEYGIPMPLTKALSMEEDAVAFLKEHKQIVIKPADQGHGDGVTTNIKYEDQIAPAVANARLWSQKLLMQNQVVGTDYRLLIVEGKMIAAAKRLPARVVGDGVSTIEELIAAANKNRGVGHGHSSPLTQISISDARAFLGEMAVLNVPKHGETVYVVGTANVSRGGEAIDVTDTVHPEIRDMACRFAEICGLGVCGADLMCRDITQPPAVSKPFFIEFNAGPGFRMHTCPSEGKGRDVAGTILDAMVAQNRRNKRCKKNSLKEAPTGGVSWKVAGACFAAGVAIALGLSFRAAS